jgi:hypothetical protein
MKPPETNLIAKRVIWYETIAILFVIALSWFDEIFDIPFHFLGGEATPINWRESVFESIVIAIMGAVVIRYTYTLLRRVSYLESLLPVCGSCKKIKVDPEFWKDIERLIQERANAEFIHGICPDCINRYYPELSVKSRNGASGSE